MGLRELGKCGNLNPSSDWRAAGRGRGVAGSREGKWWVSKPTSGDQHNFPERKFFMLSQYPASRIWIYWFTGILLSLFSKSPMWTEIGFLPKMSQILHLLVITLALLSDKIKWIFTSLFFADYQKQHLNILASKIDNGIFCQTLSKFKSSFFVNAPDIEEVYNSKSLLNKTPNLKNGNPLRKKTSSWPQAWDNLYYHMPVTSSRGSFKILTNTDFRWTEKSQSWLEAQRLKVLGNISILWFSN